MTYEEALKLKKQIGENITVEGASMNVFVGPKSSKNIGRYLAEYKENQDSFTDSIAKKYSENNDFICYALSIVDFNVVHKPIYNIGSIKTEK